MKYVIVSLSAGNGHKQGDTVAGVQLKIHAGIVEVTVNIELVVLLQPVTTFNNSSV